MLDLVVKTLLGMPTSHIGVSELGSTSDSSFLLKCTLGGNSAASSTWVPVTHMGDLH